LDEHRELGDGSPGKHIAGGKEGEKKESKEEDESKAEEVR
jgi:hypothetical protein